MNRESQINQQPNNNLKTNQIDTVKAAVILVRDRMRELGFEYQLNKRTLELKLLYGRKLIVRLPNDSATMERMLGRLPQYVEAVNSVPGEYRVTSRIHTITDAETADKQTAKPATAEIPFEMTIEEIIVRLSKNRELSRPTEGLTMGEVAQLCDEMSAYIDAIDSVPCNFRIRPVLSCDKWVVETP
ncbi:MAG: hypothetical protein J5651_08035 [Salinivirgaceae bacterium]|nr:hypothetical protein [Salinivirgaceae bacterium]